MKFKIFSIAIILSIIFPILPIFAADGKAKTKIAIVDFDVKGNVDIKDAGGSIAEILGVSLQKSGSFDVYERTQLKKILKEQELSLVGLMSESTAIKIGQLSGVQNLVVGSLIEFGNEYTLTARLINTETGKISQTGLIRAKSTRELISKVDLLSGQLQGRPMTDIEEKQARLGGEDSKTIGAQTASVLGLKKKNGLKVILNKGVSDGVAVGNGYLIYLPKFEESEITSKQAFTGVERCGKMKVTYVEQGMCMGTLYLNDESDKTIEHVGKEGIAYQTFLKVTPLFFDVNWETFYYTKGLPGFVASNIAQSIFKADLSYFPLSNDSVWIGLGLGYNVIPLLDKNSSKNDVITDAQVGFFLLGDRFSIYGLSVGVDVMYHPFKASVKSQKNDKDLFNPNSNDHIMASPKTTLGLDLNFYIANKFFMGFVVNVTYGDFSYTNGYTHQKETLNQRIGLGYQMGFRF